MYVNVYEHDGDKYVNVHSVRVVDAIQRAYGMATRVSMFQGATFPKSFALSPCSRFVLLGLVLLDFHYGPSDEFVSPRTSVAGVCILDLDDLHQGRVASGWVECRQDSVPCAVRWNRAGMWLETHEGVLLLGV